MFPPMKYSKDTLKLTEQFESCRLVAYLDCNGVPTIGYGHTYGVKLGMTCTVEQAERLLALDIAWAEARVNEDVKIDWLKQGEFDALVDFTFNCGVGNFEHSTLLQLINRGDLELAAKEFEKWDHAGGKVVSGLLRRRQAEEAEFMEAEHA
jgi:lysozyme